MPFPLTREQNQLLFGVGVALIGVATIVLVVTLVIRTFLGYQLICGNGMWFILPTKEQCRNPPPPDLKVEVGSPVSWNQRNRDGHKDLKDQETHTAVLGDERDVDFCFLTRVTGEFSGDGEYVQVVRENGTWLLKGGSHQSDIGGSALCVKLSLN